MQVLGAFGSKTSNSNLTSFLIDKDVVIDAGNLINGLDKQFLDIRHILITHIHFDHVADLPIAIDTYYSQIKESIHVYGTGKTIEFMKAHIFNDIIWADFSNVPLINSDDKIMIFHELKYDNTYTIGNIKIIPFENNHFEGSCGFIINEELLLTSDTYICDNIWDILNKKPTINKIITEISYPSYLAKLAALSKHYTPEILKNELKKLNRDDIEIYANHLKYEYIDEIKAELENFGREIQVLNDNFYIELDSLKSAKKVINPLNEALIITLLQQQLNSVEELVKKQSEHIKKLNEIGVALSFEHDLDKLLELILKQAKIFTNADAGTLYMMSEDKKSLHFRVVETDSLNIKMGGSGDIISWPPLELYRADGSENREMVAAVCALDGDMINIPDVYESKGFNFNGTKAFDKSTGFKSTSMLVIPMKNNDNEVVGVCQLINRQNSIGFVTQFSINDEEGIKPLASQAAVAITNVNLIDNLEKLLESFITSIAAAIDAKSPYTGYHVNKVAEITEIITNAINETKHGKYKDIHYTKDQLKEIHMSALMHDVGKISTPTHIMDKATKLETLYDRINTIETRFELLIRDKYIDMIEKIYTLDNQDQIESLKKKYNEEVDQIKNDLEFLKVINVGGEFMSDDNIEKLRVIATQKITISDIERDFLDDDEVHNLSIKRGTLTHEEMKIMHDHAFMSNKMLGALPFPTKLARVPEIAGGHHEKLNGKGYPNGLTAEQLSLESRILAVSDIFEALTAADRPYKKPKKLSEVMRIIDFMIKDEELDGDLVNFFYDNNLHIKYANQSLLKEQIDV